MSGWRGSRVVDIVCAVAAACRLGGLLHPVTPSQALHQSSRKPTACTQLTSAHCAHKQKNARRLDYATILQRTYRAQAVGRALLALLAAAAAALALRVARAAAGAA